MFREKAIHTKPLKRQPDAPMYISKIIGIDQYHVCAYLCAQISFLAHVQPFDCRHFMTPI